MTKTVKKRPPGRPPKAKSAMLKPVTIRFPQEMVAQIDAIAAQRMDQPERATMIRELVAEALEARRREK